MPRESVFFLEHITKESGIECDHVVVGPDMEELELLNKVDSLGNVT